MAHPPLYGKQAYQSTPISHACWNETGKTPSTVWNLITGLPELSERTVNSCLSEYFLRYWSAPYLVSKIKYGKVEIEGNSHHIYFHANGSVGKLKLLDKYSQVRLSFRVPKPVTGLPSVVYITLPIETEEPMP